MQIKLLTATCYMTVSVRISFKARFCVIRYFWLLRGRKLCTECELHNRRRILVDDVICSSSSCYCIFNNEIERMGPEL